jgi:hypothetical protein
MAKLNAHGGTLAVQEIYDPGKRGNVFVLPETEVGIRNAPFGQDPCRLNSARLLRPLCDQWSRPGATSAFAAL